VDGEVVPLDLHLPQRERHLEIRNFRAMTTAAAARGRRRRRGLSVAAGAAHRNLEERGGARERRRRRRGGRCRRARMGLHHEPEIPAILLLLAPAAERSSPCWLLQNSSSILHQVIDDADRFEPELGRMGAN